MYQIGEPYKGTAADVATQGKIVTALVTENTANELTYYSCEVSRYLSTRAMHPYTHLAVPLDFRGCGGAEHQTVRALVALLHEATIRHGRRARRRGGCPRSRG